MDSRSILFARLAIAMAITYQLLAIIMIFLRPDLGVYWNTISEWAIGKYGWLMQSAFVSSGLSYLFLLQAIKLKVNGGPGRSGLILLCICFLGTIGVGVFVSDPYPPDFTIIKTCIHSICGGLGMILLPLAALLINQNLIKRNKQFTDSKRILKWTALLPLIGLLSFIIHFIIFIIPLGENAIGEDVPIGYPPRFLFLTYHIWLIVLCFQVIKKHNTNAA